VDDVVVLWRKGGKTMTALQAPHRSRVGKRSQPKGLESTRLPDDVRMMVEQEALDIFTSMSNAGQPLSKTLAAIFLSGMNASQTVRQT
jgi:hypothetical protein